MRSIRWRLTLFHTLAILGITSLLLGVGIFALYRSVRTGVEETTQGRAVAAERLLSQGDLPSHEELASLTEGEVYLIIRDASGAILATAGSPPLRYDELGADADRAWQQVVETGAAATDSARELHVSALPVEGGTSGAAVVEAWKSYDTAAESYLPDVRILTQSPDRGCWSSRPCGRSNRSPPPLVRSATNRSTSGCRSSVKTRSASWR
jgi:hypothetical protein